MTHPTLLAFKGFSKANMATLKKSLGHLETIGTTLRIGFLTLTFTQSSELTSDSIDVGTILYDFQSVMRHECNIDPVKMVVNVNEKDGVETIEIKILKYQEFRPKGGQQC